MERESVLCRIEVAHLDRAYRHARRAKDEVVRRCPEMASVVENAFESIRQLYTDAHVHSNGVPLSHRQFAEIGLSELPDWARNDD
jgi:hypothetical protein